MITNFKLYEYSLASHIGKAYTFDPNMKLPWIFNLSCYGGKKIRVNWNDNKDHDIIQRMKKYQRAESVSDYIKLFEKAFSEVIPEIEEKNKLYSIYFMERNFYILFEMRSGILWDLSKPAIKIITILPYEPYNADTVFEVDDTYYLVY